MWRQNGECLMSLLLLIATRQNNTSLWVLRYSLKRVESRATHLEFLINDDVKIAWQHLTGTTTKVRALFKMTDSEQNL